MITLMVQKLCLRSRISGRLFEDQSDIQRSAHIASRLIGLINPATSDAAAPSLSTFQFGQVTFDVLSPRFVEESTVRVLSGTGGSEPSMFNHLRCVRLPPAALTDNHEPGPTAER